MYGRQEGRRLENAAPTKRRPFVAFLMCRALRKYNTHDAMTTVLITTQPRQRVLTEDCVQRGPIPPQCLCCLRTVQQIPRRESKLKALLHCVANTAQQTFSRCSRCERAWPQPRSYASRPPEALLSHPEAVRSSHIAQQRHRRGDWLVVRVRARGMAGKVTRLMQMKRSTVSAVKILKVTF